MSRTGFVVPALAACVLSVPLWAADSGEQVPAAWAPKELMFVYQGFTTRYSCDGLRDKMRGVLLDLGARKQDLKVLELGCTSSTGKPDPFPGIRAKLSVLQPASGASNDPQAPVAAHWKPIDLKLRDTFTTASGECELMEQIRDKVLPLFATRNVEFHADCIPHQASVTQPTLKLEVLWADDAQHWAAEPQATR